MHLAQLRRHEFASIKNVTFDVHGLRYRFTE
jgi:hypothetical protein